MSRIRRRFLDQGVAGLATRPKAGRKDHAVEAATEERLVELAVSPPPAGRSRWTTRLLAKEVGLTSGCVSDVLRRNGLTVGLPLVAVPAGVQAAGSDDAAATVLDIDPAR